MITFCGVERMLKDSKNIILFLSIDSDKPIDGILAHSTQAMDCESIKNANAIEKDSSLFKGTTFPNSLSYLCFINLLIDSCK